MSRRAQKKVSTFTSGSWSLTSSTSYIYDGWNLVKEQSTINNQPSTSFYVWGLDLSGSLQGAGGIGGLLARVKDGAAQQYTFDGNGNVSELTDASGNIAAHFEYDPYGNAIVATGDNPFRFSTKFFDDETGLLYYGYRFYSPVLGRWLNRDPMGIDGGLNPYSFLFNDGINACDMFGLWRIKRFIYKDEWHGNWGGPDWTAGQNNKSWNQFTEAEKNQIYEAIKRGDKDVAPIDSQDELYMQHDISYGDCRDKCAKVQCPLDCEKNCFNKADITLANELLKLGFKKPHWLKVWCTVPIFYLQPGYRERGYDEKGNYYQFRWNF